MVSAPDGKSYILKKGVMVGRNEGVVVEITPEAVQVEERYYDFSGEIRKSVQSIHVISSYSIHYTKLYDASSSAGIFGELKSLPIGEDHPAEPDTPYGCSKLYEEKVCMAYAKLYGLEAVCLRYFNVYGPRQRFGSLDEFFAINEEAEKRFEYTVSWIDSYNFV